jgi:enoyl-CoA hydratase/carnithine racemase
MHLLTSCQQRVLHLVLNRQDKRNALDADMCSGIVKAITDAQQRTEVGCILISAHGSVFCSGMDLDEAVGPNAGQLAGVHEALFTIGMTSLKPIVVCAGGAALGGGLGLVAQGHVVLAAEGAAFALTEIRVGLWPFLVYRAVEAALGARRTLELSLTGHVFHSQEALEWGLVHQVCPAAETLERAKGLAREIAKASPLAISTGMRYVRDARGRSQEQAGELAAALRDGLMRSDDFKEGVAAFKHRREPRWPSMPQEPALK